MYKAGKLGREFSIFVKRHQMICVLLLLSLFIVAKNSAIPAPAWLPQRLKRIFICPAEGTAGAEWLSLMNNLSLAFIGSMITYMLIQYIPERRKAYRAYSILKSEICSLYNYMSYLIGMYLFEIGFAGEENKVTVSAMKGLCNVEILDQDHFCCIERNNNGKKIRVPSFSYNLYKDSKKYKELILKSVDAIKGTICVGDLDPVLLNILSTISNNRFLQYFSFLDVPQQRIPGAKTYIVAFDTGFYDFVQTHILLEEYDFHKIVYEFSIISDEELAKEREEQLFLINRVSISLMDESEVETITDQIIALPPNEERIGNCVRVVLEMLMFYDFHDPKQDGILECALKIAEYVRKNELEPNKADFAILNIMQIKKRLNTITTDDLVELQKMILNAEKGNKIITGASILYGDYGKAADAFNALTQEEKQSYIKLPIYRLWPDPPVLDNNIVVEKGAT